MGIKSPDGTKFEPFPPTGLDRDCSYHTPLVPSEEAALQDTVRSEVEKPAWIQFYRNDTDGAETVRNVSSNQELEKRLEQHLSDMARNRKRYACDTSFEGLEHTTIVPRFVVITEEQLEQKVKTTQGQEGALAKHTRLG